MKALHLTEHVHWSEYPLSPATVVLETHLIIKTRENTLDK
jgi:hypothetical protein